MRRTDLLDRLLAFPVSQFSETVYRATRRGLQPDTPSISGGRWIPPGLCPVLYTCLTRDGALAEMTYRQSLLNPIPSKPLFVHRLRVSLTKVMRLTLDDLLACGVESENYRTPNYSKTREIGDAVWFLEHDGLIVPSARSDCDNLVIFTDQLTSPEISISLVESEEVDWLAWAKERGIQLPHTPL